MFFIKLIRRIFCISIARSGDLRHSRDAFPMQMCREFTSDRIYLVRTERENRGNRLFSLSPPDFSDDNLQPGSRKRDSWSRRVSDISCSRKLRSSVLNRQPGSHRRTRRAGRANNAVRGRNKRTSSAQTAKIAEKIPSPKKLMFGKRRTPVSQQHPHTRTIQHPANSENFRQKCNKNY